MKRITKERLLNAGWTKTRKINITKIQDKYQEAEMNLPDNVINFLAKCKFF